jgi:predicted hotdog family 3-hydroxylacyl-ACP dehydratase
VTIRIAVPGGGPLFEGHFPGRPILPGVSELALVARALAPPGSSEAIRAIPFLRFRHLVMPGDRLEVSASGRLEDGATRFAVRRAGGLVANGAILFGHPELAQRPGSSFAVSPARNVPGFDTLIPHRAPMRFVGAILGEAEDGMTCLARIPAECALVENGVAPAFAGIEAAAQTAAVWEAVRRSREEAGAQARIGYLVSVREVVLHRGTVPSGADLFVSVRLEALAPPLATYTVEVVLEGEIALRGSIGTYLSG